MAFQDAIYKHNYEAVKAILETNPEEANSTDKDERPRLISATYNGDWILFKLLLQHGASVNARDAQGRTALHPAAHLMCTTFTKPLLQHGADVNVRDNQGFTPLHFAAFMGSASTVQMLLREGADIDAISNEGRSVFELVVANDNSSDVCQVLVEWQHFFWQTRIMAFCQGLHVRLGQHSSVRRAFTSDLSERYLIWKIGLFLKPNL